MGYVMWVPKAGLGRVGCKGHPPGAWACCTEQTWAPAPPHCPFQAQPVFRAQDRVWSAGPGPPKLSQPLECV